MGIRETLAHKCSALHLPLPTFIYKPVYGPKVVMSRLAANAQAPNSKFRVKRWLNMGFNAVGNANASEGFIAEFCRACRLSAPVLEPTISTHDSLVSHDFSST